MASILTDLQEGNDPLTHPQKVLPVPRLRSDVRCLLDLLDEDSPTIQCV
jgi:hypothetical protein